MNEIENQVENNPLTKEEARIQFEEKTKEYGLKHAFSFDDMWGMMEDYKKRKEFREKIGELQEVAMNSSQFLKGNELSELNPVKHKFAEGLYIREIFNPANQLLITKVHNKQHTFFLMKGKMSIITEEGIQTIEAPYNGITEPNTKRLIYTHTDCVFTTVHAAESQDIEELEATLVSDNYENDLLESDYIQKLIQESI